MDYYDSSIKEEMSAVSSKFDQSYWRQVCEEKLFPDEYWNALSKSGLFGIMIEKKFGGMERGLVDLSIAVEETAENFAGIASYLYLSGSLVSTIFSANASEVQKKEFLPKLARGETKVSIALGEEVSGFDAASIETRAVKSEGGFRISGEKAFVNNVDQADYLILFARTTPLEKSEKKSLGVSMFIVDAKDPKIKSTKLEKLGWDFLNNFRIKFEDLKVESSKVLGELDRAWYNAVASFNLDRVATSASLVGTGKLALALASSWAKQRVIFGREIGSNQGIQFPLAEAFAYLEASWMMTLKAAMLRDRGKSYVNEANYSLLSSSNAAMNSTDRALQTFGGHGYYKDYDVERHWRDVRVHRIHPISEELLLGAIAERALGLPKSY
ncbi:MAG TPA: acyl-CoA dehydrogenase family protein [Nitrososphaerales archaeon]|nr:acyl-CoA dehydrogenase family protein [Nitrososphaerales archaeon]